jgi:hypothetical protein
MLSLRLPLHNPSSLLLLVLIVIFFVPSLYYQMFLSALFVYVQDLAAVLAAEYPQGLDIVYEGVGGSVRAAIMPHLAPGGRLLQVGYISGGHTRVAFVILTIVIYVKLLCEVSMRQGLYLLRKEPQGFYCVRLRPRPKRPWAAARVLPSCRTWPLAAGCCRLGTSQVRTQNL